MDEDKKIEEVNYLIQKAKDKNDSFLSLYYLELGELLNNLLSKFSDFTELYLDGNKLEKLPDEIENLTGLEILHLFDNKLKLLTKKIGKLSNLQNLSVAYNQLSELPTEIGMLTRLEKLDLSYNHIGELPTEIGMLDRLEKLDLSHNQLKKLPKSMDMLSNLQELNISYNQLSELSIVRQLTGLQKLIINGNPISEEDIEKLNKALPDTKIIPIETMQNRLKNKIEDSELKIITYDFKMPILDEFGSDETEKGESWYELEFWNADWQEHHIDVIKKIEKNWASVRKQIIKKVCKVYKDVYYEEYGDEDYRDEDYEGYEEDEKEEYEFEEEVWPASVDLSNVLDSLKLHTVELYKSDDSITFTGACELLQEIRVYIENGKITVDQVY